MATRIKIIGVGSPFGDDRLGWLAAQKLQMSPVLHKAIDKISIMSLDRPGPSMISQWQDTDAVIVVDAVRSGARPGTVHCLDASAIDAGSGTTSCHGFGVASAMELARALNQMPQTMYLCGIEIDPAYTGEDLSPAARKALQELVGRIEELAGIFIRNPAVVT